MNEEAIRKEISNLSASVGHLATKIVELEVRLDRRSNVSFIGVPAVPDANMEMLATLLRFMTRSEAPAELKNRVFELALELSNHVLHERRKETHSPAGS